MNYARFNLGVALVRSNRLEEGARQLDAVGHAAVDATMSCWRCKDKANLALGFAYLQDQQAGAGETVRWSACASTARSPRARCWGWAGPTRR